MKLHSDAGGTSTLEIVVGIFSGAPLWCECWFINLVRYIYHKPYRIQPLFLGNWTLSNGGPHPAWSGDTSDRGPRWLRCARCSSMPSRDIPRRVRARWSCSSLLGLWFSLDWYFFGPMVHRSCMSFSIWSCGTKGDCLGSLAWASVGCGAGLKRTWIMKKSDQVMGIFIRKRKWVYVSKTAGDEFVSWRFHQKSWFNHQTFGDVPSGKLTCCELEDHHFSWEYPL